ncbi:MAG: hypothetical protein OEX75_11080 [Gammaproteobacteria bacterium]|nr:hypothetical protein [Gammaproteobacteria bacterium]
MNIKYSAVLSAIFALCISVSPPAWSAENSKIPEMQDGKISLTLRDVSIAEIMEMLSRAGHVNILLSNNVEGNVSVNLYDMDIDRAIRSIATSAGFAVERRNGNYFIVDRDEAGKSAPGGPTSVRTYKVQYSDTETVANVIKNHLSTYGQVTTLPERRLLVIEDTPYFHGKVKSLLEKLDREPKQIMIEARILEVGLKDSESFGLDWGAIFESGDISVGTQGLGSPGSPGLFFDMVKPDVTLVLDALRKRDRLRTLSTPKLLALEGQEAETIIGDRLGYNVTTTIDSVTTTSTEFLESGVILRVKPSVDDQNRIFLEIHPEVSTGSVSQDGVPNQSTTEVTTSMLVDSGQTVFIGGLIKRTSEQIRDGVPVLGDLPVIGALFSNRSLSSVNTELVVLITPYIVDNDKVPLDGGKLERVNQVAAELEEQPRDIEEALDKLDYFEDMLAIDVDEL